MKHFSGQLTKVQKLYRYFSVLCLFLQTSVTPVPRNQVARSASVSEVVYCSVLFVLLQTSVTPVARNQVAHLSNVSVFVLYVIIVF